MGLFDAVREKAAELLSGATEKVSELTGTEIADPRQHVADTAQDLGDSAQGHADAATGAGQDLAGTTGESVRDAVTDAGDQVAPRGRG
jgi:uncharacterized protein YjbJ (UPF0337 family)